MPLLEQAGNFRGTFTEYGLRKADSGAKAISVVAAIDAWWNPEINEWEDWREYLMTVTGDLWIIKKDGTVNSPQVESLVRNTGWNTSLESIANGTWQPTPCSFSVTEEVYKEETRYKIAFLNAYDRKPGVVGNVSADEAKALQTQYGAQFRALAGNVQRNDVKPDGKPTMPKALPKQLAKTALGKNTADLNAQLQEAAVEAENETPW